MLVLLIPAVVLLIITLDYVFIKIERYDDGYEVEDQIKWVKQTNLI